MKYRKKVFESIALMLVLMFFSCKNDQKETKEIKRETVNNISKKDNKTVISLINDVLDKDLIEIVNEDQKFKLSCTKKYKKVKLEKHFLNIEIIEPISYEVERIEETNIGFKVYFKEESFYYDVSLVDKNIGVLYWKNLSIKDNIIDNDFSFYTVEEIKLKSINLEKQICNETPDEVSELPFDDSITWYYDCSNVEKYTYNSVNFNKIASIFSFKNYNVRVDLKKTNINEYDIFFSYPFIKSNPANYLNWGKDFSQEIAIGNFKYLNNRIEFTWLGFYNTKTKKRELLESPFTNKIEKKSIILKECRSLKFDEKGHLIK